MLTRAIRRVERRKNGNGFATMQILDEQLDLSAARGGTVAPLEDGAVETKRSQETWLLGS